MAISSAAPNQRGMALFRLHRPLPFRLGLRRVRSWPRHVLSGLHLREEPDGYVFGKRDVDLVSGAWHSSTSVYKDVELRPKHFRNRRMEVGAGDGIRTRTSVTARYRPREVRLPIPHPGISRPRTLVQAI
jgi:hypothetical protein